MLKNLLAYIRFYFFWLLFFALNRIVFELYFFDKLNESSIREVLLTFLYSLRIDSSTAGYIAALPILLYVVGWLFRSISIPNSWLRIYTIICICIVSFTTIIDLNIYREWGTKINYRAFAYFFESPKEAIASSGNAPVFLSLSISLLLLFAGIFLSKRIIANPTFPELNIFVKLPVAVLLLGVTFLTIRGGWQVSTMNQSMAYFSNKPILNHAALNTQWNLIHSIINNSKSSKNPFIYLPEKQASELVDSLYHQLTLSKTPDILHIQRPNVVVLMLESFTADVIESMGGEQGVTPHFDDLISQGILFDHIYSASDRTDKGIIGILSAFPAQAIKKVMTENTKQEKLPAISQVFKNADYETSFYYGGQSEFTNLKSYLLSHDFNNLVDQNAFEKKDMNSKWGAYDDVVLNKQLSDLNRSKQPFFSALMTLTNHEPFELPTKPHFPGKEKGDMFRSTAFFTDSCLSDYFSKAKKQAWYKNTLFILVADHGHYLPGSIYEPYHPGKYRIPLLFFGEVIKEEFRGTKIHKLGNQTDIAATLFTQLNLPFDQFKWSKDLLNAESKDFAFFNWDNGFCFMLPEQSVSFDNVGKNIIYIENQKVDQQTNEKTLLYGKAYMQQIFTEYLNL
jgi:phosphoglycerol transferase MdoB-like AlkP superfamily enzyme